MAVAYASHDGGDMSIFEIEREAALGIVLGERVEAAFDGRN